MNITVHAVYADGVFRPQRPVELAEGTQVLLTVYSPAQPHPWMEFAGMFKDDPWIEDWVQSMGEYRQQVEDDPER